MTLAAIDLLVAVVATDTAYFGGLHALGVDAGGAGRLFPARLGADLAAQGIKDLLPGAVFLPGDEVIPGRAFGYEIVRQVVPLYAGAALIEQGVDHLAHIDLSASAAMLGGRDQRFNDFPLCVGLIRRIAFSHGQVLAVRSSGATPSLLGILRTARLPG